MPRIASPFIAPQPTGPRSGATLHGLSDAGAGAFPLPKRIRILAWGENPNSNGERVFVGARLVEALKDPLCAFREVALDFEHNTVPGSKEYERTTEPRPVAGYGRVAVEEGRGVFLEMLRWTPEGEAMAHHYRDVSATPVLDKDGEVVAVASVALCRNGAVPGAENRESTLSTTHQPQTPKETRKMDFKAILLKILGLPDDASEEDIAKAAEAAMKPADKPAEPAPAEPEGGVAPLAARIEALERRADRAEKEAILAGARAEGKVVALAADALDALTPAQLRETVAKTPATVPLSAKTPGTVRETAAKAEETDEERRVRELCGLTREEVEKWA